ncbi:GTP 3',8-cyclase MoaA [Endozoicomonas atrinae]|uniref:GTP 3',8-cyclase MoaA n=1 Tax=Endozoicomonas atrinae TaxID=1333660 RepID=UPI0008254FB0|nr:GTP 3',8-cyclase MoaA [Endozoicomonas atrinae]
MQPLQDLQGRKFPYLRLSVTDLCNFRCNYCLPDGCLDHHHSEALTIDEVRRLVTAFASVGVEKIRLTGGEPTLRQDFSDIVRTIKQIPGIKKLAMTTNGYKMDQRVTDWLDAGIDAINVSVDSLDPRAFELITGHNRLREILSGIQNAFDHGLPSIKVNAVAMKGINDDELDAFLDWIRDYPVSVRFMELMQTGNNLEFFQKHHFSGKKIQELLLERGWVRKVRLYDAGPAQEYCHSNYEGTIGLIMPYSKDFCNDCNRLRITSLGQLQLCLFAESGIDLRDLLQSDGQQEELLARIRDSLRLKEDGHFLDQGWTGGTQSISQVGG